MKKSAVCAACGKPCIKFLTNYIVVQKEAELLKHWYHSEKEKKNKECSNLIKSKTLETLGFYFTTSGRRVDKTPGDKDVEQDVPDETE